MARRFVSFVAAFWLLGSATHAADHRLLGNFTLIDGTGARATALAHRMRITAGSDWFEPREPEVLPHTHRELALPVEAAGLSPLEAITAGIRNGAEARRIAATRGTVVIGKAADFLVLNANLLEDIGNTTAVRMVVKDGEIVSP